MAGPLCLVWLFLFLHSVTVSQAETKDTKGKSFTLAFFPEFVNLPGKDLRNVLYLSSMSNGTCTVSYNDDARRIIQVTLVAHQVVKKPLPDTTQMLNIGTGVQPKAIYVNCSVDIALYGFNAYEHKGDTSDSFTVLPNSILSDRYLVASLNNSAFIGVVAVTGDTQLSINIKSNSMCLYSGTNYTSGDIINVTLACGDVFRIGNVFADSCDFGGTEIYSSNPLAVYSGSLYGGSLGSHLVHQVPPMTAFSHTVIIPGFREKTVDRPVIRVIANHNNTVFKMTLESIYGGSSALLHHIDNRDILDLVVSSASHIVIQSNFPILVVQKVIFLSVGGSLLFIPGISQYEKCFLIRAMDLDKPGRGPRLTVVSESSSIRDVRVNGVYPQGVTWFNLTTLPYSIGSLRIQRNVSYTVSSSSPILVRFHEEEFYESYVSVAGYQLAGTVVAVDVNNTIHVDLKCLPGGWIVRLDLSELNPRPSDPVSEIYMDKDNCTGTFQGDYLVFNKTYRECNTRFSVSNGQLHYTNTLLYTRPSAEHLVTDVIWLHDINCATPVDVTDSVHIYPDFNVSQHTGTSGVILGSIVDVSLYRDASYQHPVTDYVVKAKIGQPVYVQVTSPGHPNAVMVVQSCDAHLEENKHISYPLIKNGCASNARTQILITRNQVTRFKFLMFDLPTEQDGIYVTCHVIFCDPMDFSAKCLQRCATDPQTGIVG